MFTLPNIITLLRFPLVLAFLQDNATIRAVALILAMLSDGIDGYYARRFNVTSRIGTFLDPLADKVFVIVILAVFLTEHRLLPWEAVTMLSRDIAVFLFGLYLTLKGTIVEYQFRAIWYGKIMTTLQFTVIFSLIFGVIVPSVVYLTFVLLGVLSFAELYRDRKRLKVE